MQTNQRQLTKIIKEICIENKIELQAFSFDWIFRLTKNGRTTHVFGYQFANNSATSQIICSDKAAASELLINCGIPAVKHHFFMTPTNIDYYKENGNWNNLLDLLKTHGKLVCKQNEGSGGNNVYLATNEFELEKAATKIFSHSRSMAVSPFYDIENEFRIVILNGNVKLIYSKNIPYILGDGMTPIRDLLIEYLEKHSEVVEIPSNTFKTNATILKVGEKHFLTWKHNLGQGAVPEIIRGRIKIKALSELALLAAKAIGINFASVDIIKTENKYLILEINSGVMMEHFSKTSPKNYRKAKSIYQEAIFHSLNM